MAGPWSVRTRKPKSAVRVNQAHPLARDIAFFYYETVGIVAGNATFYDAVTGKMHGTAFSQSAISSSDPIGGGRSNIFCNNGNGSNSAAYTNPNAISTQFLTVFSRFKPTAKPGSKTQAVAYGKSDASLGVYVGVNSSGNAIGGVSGTNGMTFANDAVDHTGQWINVSGCGDGAASGISACYVNGVKFGSGASGTNVGQAVTTVSIGRDAANYYNSFTGEIAVAIGWNRILTDAEHLLLSNNPWQILQPANDIKWFSLDAGVVGITGDAAWTEGQDVWAAAGQVDVAGSAAWTEGADSLAASGTVGAVSGSAAWTEAQDNLAASGTVTLPAVTGTIAIVEASDSLAGDVTAGTAGGHFYPTRQELAAARKRAKQAEDQREAEWAARRADQEDIRKTAERIARGIRDDDAPKINEPLFALTSADDEDGDIETILLYG